MIVIFKNMINEINDNTCEKIKVNLKRENTREEDELGLKKKILFKHNKFKHKRSK